MIARGAWRGLVLFGLLLGGGLWALQAFAGDLVVQRPPESIEPPERPQQRQPGTGVVVPAEGAGGQVTVTIRGGLETVGEKLIALDDGTTRAVRTYDLRALDSRPVPERDNLLELLDVSATLHRIARDAAGVPSEVAAATLAARSVLVEVEHDDQGRPSIREDKEMDFRDAVLRTVPSPHGVSTPAELRVRSARLRIEPEQARLFTAPGEAFTLVLGGSRAATITGRGVDATVPTAREARGSEPMLLRVLSHPVLTFDDGSARVAATGELTYSERPDEVGELDLRGAVEMAFRRGGDTMTAHGDRLQGWLRRGAGGGESSDTTFRLLRLTGAAVELVTADLSVGCTELEVLPAVGDGRPRLVTASGSPTTLRLLGAGGRHSEFESERRVHLLSLPAHLGPYLRPLGFGSDPWPGFDELVVFEDRTSVRLAVPEREGTVELHAEDGIHVLRGRERTFMRGRGAIVATPGDGLHLEGASGFTLHQSGSGDDLRLRLRLPADPDGQAPLTIRRDALTLTGTGWCRIEQDRDGGNLTAASDAGTLEAELERGRLLDLRSLRVDLVGDALSGLHAAGTPCRLEARTADGRLLEGKATTVDSTDGDSFVLVGAPALLTAGVDGTVAAPLLRVVTVDGGDQVLLFARDGSRLQVRRDDAGTPVAADLRADRLDLLPWLLPPVVGAWHASFLPAGSLRPFAIAAGERLVASRGAVRVDMQRDAVPVVAGEGDDLLLRLSEGHALGRLRGKPAWAEVVPRGSTERSRGTGDDLAFSWHAPGDDARLHLAPARDGIAELLLRGVGAEAGAEPARAPRDIRVRCSGPIDVLPREVVFRGPAEVCPADGGDGMRVTSRQLHAIRDVHGDVTDMVAEGDATFAVGGLRATGDVLALDLRRTTCTLASERGSARVTTSGGMSWTAARLQVNWSDLSVRAWYGDVRDGGTR